MHLILIAIIYMMNINVYQHKNQINLTIILIIIHVTKDQTYVLKSLIK